MKNHDRNRIGKSKDALVNINLDKNAKIEKIKNLVLKIKKIENAEQDISISIIQCFIQDNFKELTANEIINYIKQYEEYEINENKKIDIKNDVNKALNNNEIFILGKDRTKYELKLEKTISYLNTILNNCSSNVSNLSNNFPQELDYSSPTFNFPENQNNIVNFACEENDNEKYNDNYNEHKSLSIANETVFTFGEQTQTNTNIINNKINSEEEIMKQYTPEEIKEININKYTNEQYTIMNKKAKEKFIPDFNLVFDKNDCFSNFEKIFTKTIEKYKNNLEEKNFPKFENVVKSIYKKIKEINNKRSPFNEKANNFNEQRDEFIEMSGIVKEQYELIKKIIKNDIIDNVIIKEEKILFQIYQNNFSNLFELLKNTYNDIKILEKKIISYIKKLKEDLNELCDEFLGNNDNEYKEFFDLVKKIKNPENIIINVNINDIIDLSYCYINEFNIDYKKIEEKIKRKK